MNTSYGRDGNGLMDKVDDRQTMLLVLQGVEKNKGAPGMDNVIVNQFRDYVREHLVKIREELLEGTYGPQLVRRA